MSGDKDAPLTIAEECVVEIRGVRYAGVIVGFDSLGIGGPDPRSCGTERYYEQSSDCVAFIELQPAGGKLVRRKRDDR